jgi:hypothetical protein
MASIARAFHGVYGAWVNTDGFTIGEQKETYAGMRIFEIAKQTESMRHFVWSNLDYGFKVGLIDKISRQLVKRMIFNLSSFAERRIQGYVSL